MSCLRWVKTKVGDNIAIMSCQTHVWPFIKPFIILWEWPLWGSNPLNWFIVMKIRLSGSWFKLPKLPLENMFLKNLSLLTKKVKKMWLSTKTLIISIDNEIFSTLLVNKDKLKKMCFSTSEWRLETLPTIRNLI